MSKNPQPTPKEIADQLLLKAGIVAAFLGYSIIEVALEFFTGETEGFTLPLFLIAELILLSGLVLCAVLGFRSWKRGQEAAAQAWLEEQNAPEETEERGADL